MIKSFKKLVGKRKRKGNTRKPNVQNLTDCANYRSFRNKCVNAIKKKVRSECQLQLSSNINNCKNSRKWWKIIGKLLRHSHDHDAPPLIVNGQVYENDKDKVSLLNEFFCKQTEIDESSSHLPNYTSSVSNNLSSITLS